MDYENDSFLKLLFKTFALNAAGVAGMFGGFILIGSVLKARDKKKKPNLASVKNID